MPENFEKPWSWRWPSLFYSGCPYWNFDCWKSKPSFLEDVLDKSFFLVEPKSSPEAPKRTMMMMMMMMLTMMLMMMIMMLLMMMMMTTVMMMMLISQEWPQEASRDPFFLPFPSPSQKITPGSLQRRSFTHFRARPRKWSQEPCRGPFLAISELKLRNGPRKHTEAQFYPFPLSLIHIWRCRRRG